VICSRRLTACGHKFRHSLSAFCCYRLNLSIDVRPPETAVQPPNSTVPCKRLYSSANAMLPFPMFQPRHAFLRPSFCRWRTSGPRLALIPTTLPARTRTSPPPPLDPPATNHRSQFAKPFGIRTSAKLAHNSFRIRTSKTQDLKPFRMNTYEKTGEGSYC